ncbi:MAG: hypothetical protein ABEJ40_07845 [Haloarculaceae archaeon]
MSSVISTYNPGGVDDAVLEGTGSGGFFSDGYLREEPLSSYVGEDETAVFVRHNSKHGVSYEHLDRDEGGTISPGSGYRAFAVFTDARVVFVIGDNETGSGSDQSITIPLSDVDVVDASSGVLAGELSLTTTADVRWRFPCNGDLDRLTDYLTAATDAWTRVESHLESARKHVVDAAQHRESREYDEAMDAVAAATEEVEGARRRELAFVADGVPAVRSRIDRTADRIADVKRETLRARATHHVNAAERCWLEGEYEAAYDRFAAAHDDYVAVVELGDTTLAASAPVRSKLAGVERNLTRLEQAPLERAEDARQRAYEAEDPAERADYLELALERYRTVLELDWGRDRDRFEGETETVREHVDGVASDLVETRRRLAAQAVRRGDEHRAAGRDGPACEAYAEARESLEATLDTARELVPGAAGPLSDHLDAVETKLADCPDPGAG